VRNVRKAAYGLLYQKNKNRLGFWFSVHALPMAELSQFSIVTYERRSGHWRAAITPIRQSGTFIKGRTISSIVTPDDFESEPDAKFAAEKMIRNI
jgi:hypothetical protein